MRDRLSVIELCTLYEISRKTAYTWIDRSRTHGPQGLEERSRRPHTSPRHTPDHVVAALLDARRRHPLTIADGDSRFLLGCEALSSTRVQEAQPVFMRVFEAFGLPKRIRTDNGVPFATNTLGRLSQLSAWWIRLGILPECIEPSNPHQHGRHERRQRTLKADTTRPPGATLRAQQQKFTHVREECNGARPHEALDLPTPASCYEPSSRKRPHKLPPLEDPARFEVRYVSAHGGIRWTHHWVNVSHVCVGAYGGREEIDDGVWNGYFGPRTLGRFLERHMRIEDA